MTFEEFVEGPKGRKLTSLFSDPAVIGRMEKFARLGAPSIKAIDGDVADAVGVLDDVERQHVGRWVRNTLAQRGWKSIKQRSWRGGRVFASGMVYEPIARPEAALLDATAEDDLPIQQRLAKARHILMAGRRNPYLPLTTVDEFLADRRAQWGSE